MPPLRKVTGRLFRPPAFRVSEERYRSAAHLSKHPSSQRYASRQGFSQPSEPRVNRPEPSVAQGRGAPASTPSVSDALVSASPPTNNLLASVHIPEDPNVVLKETHPAAPILANSGLVVQRQIEMMNLFLGFEQANRYVIMDPHGNHVGYMAEHDGGFGKVMGRQWLRTHRAFTTHVFNREQKEVLRFHRPFSWVNSQIRVYDPIKPAPSLGSTSTPTPTSLDNSSNAVVPNIAEQPTQLSSLPLADMRIIGEAQSWWAPLKRKYNLYLFYEPPSEPERGMMSASSVDLSPAQRAQMAKQPTQIDAGQYVQFAKIEEPPLSWDFSLLSASNKLIGSINRNFAGFAREIFTDTGVYALRMDAAGLEEEASSRHMISRTAQREVGYADVVGGEKSESGLTLDQRAVMLATAVTVDYDYFSRHSHGGGMGMMPLWIGGGEAAEGGAAAGGAVGATGVSEAGGAVVGGAARAGGATAGVGEGAIAGAGTMAGYEAMQRGVGRGEYGEQPVQQPPVDNASPQAPEEQHEPQPGNDGSTQRGGDDDGWGNQSNGAGRGEDVWGQNGQDPWSGQGSDSGGAGGGEGGGGSFWDIFGE